MRVVEYQDVVRTNQGFKTKVLWKVEGYISRESVYVKGPAGERIVTYKHGNTLYAKSPKEATGNGRDTFGFIIPNVTLDDAGVYNIAIAGKLSANTTLFVYGEHFLLR